PHVARAGVNPALAAGGLPHGRASRLAPRRGRAALLHAAGLPLELAQVVELGPPHLRVLDHLDLLDRARVQGKDALHALAEGDLAHGHGRAHARPAQADDDALEDLDALALGLLHALALHPDRLVVLHRGLLDPHVHAHGVARGETRQVLLQVAGFDA